MGPRAGPRRGPGCACEDAGQLATVPSRSLIICLADHREFIGLVDRLAVSFGRSLCTYVVHSKRCARLRLVNHLSWSDYNSDVVIYVSSRLWVVVVKVDKVTRYVSASLKFLRLDLNAGPVSPENIATHY